MRYVALLAAALSACSAPRTGDSPRAPAAPGRSGLGGAADSLVEMPRVVSHPAVIVFWLQASDTLAPEEAAAAYDELTFATVAVLDALTAFDIHLYPTHADTVYLELPNRVRHAVPLSGLDYPFGYVLMDPAGTERVLTGVYGHAELMDEIRVYFDLPDDTTSAPARVVTD